MARQTTSTVKLVLSDKEGLGKISVGLEPFFEFSFWMAEELQDLIANRKLKMRSHPSGLDRCKRSPV